MLRKQYLLRPLRQIMYYVLVEVEVIDFVETMAEVVTIQFNVKSLSTKLRLVPVL